MAQIVLILDQKKREFIPATFHDDLTTDQMNEAETQWKPVRDAAVKRLLDAGKTKLEVQRLFQHQHWDWSRKAGLLLGGLLSVRCFGIELNGQWQGLAMFELAAHFALLEPDQGKPLIYVEFLETAPWNIAELVDEPRYGLIGARMIEAAIRLSISEGFRGRVGLLALPQAEKFYEKKCGMTRVEEAGHHGMAWYELTQKAAGVFLKGGRS
ncbi:MAG: hypothetical protein ABFD90_18440 [Phycisphaerales bacterium]